MITVHGSSASTVYQNPLSQVEPPCEGRKYTDRPVSVQKSQAKLPPSATVTSSSVPPSVSDTPETGAPSEDRESEGATGGVPDYLKEIP